MSMEPTAVDAPEAVTPPLWRRLLDAFFSPGRMGAAVARDPRWIGALLVSMAIFAVATWLIPPELFAEMQRRAALERGVTMGPITDRTLSIIHAAAVAGGVVGFALIAFVLSGLYTLIFSFILGDEGRYRQYLALFAHASVIPALLSLALVPLRISTGDPQFTLNVGSFAFFLEDGYLANVLRLLDLTQMWSTAVIALGVTAVDKRRGFASAFGILMAMTLGVALAVAPFIPS